MSVTIANTLHFYLQFSKKTSKTIFLKKSQQIFEKFVQRKKNTLLYIRA